VFRVALRTSRGLQEDLMSYQLRILHISDLHECGPREYSPHKGESWRRRRVLGEAWDRNLDAFLQDGPLNLVCFTGDAAYSGLPEEYEAASKFFAMLLRRLDLGYDRLFLVPGNHDIARSLNRDVWEKVRAFSPQTDPLNLARWMAGGKPPPGFSNDWRDQILARQGAYRHWIRTSLGRPELDPQNSPHGFLGYRFTGETTDGGIPLHIIGLDSAWLCGDDSDAGRLLLTDAQVGNLTSDDHGRPLEGLRIALVHHPFSDLIDGAHCRRLLGERTDLVLRGHLHLAEVETWVDPDNKVNLLAAGCLYETEKADHYPSACQVITLNHDSLGHLGRVDLRFRSFSPRGGHWHDDDSFYKRSHEGRVTGFAQEPLLPVVETDTPSSGGKLNENSADVPGYWRLLWMLFMQPVSLYRRLESCGVMKTGQGADSSKNTREYIQKMATLFMTAVPLGAAVSLGILRLLEPRIEGARIFWSAAVTVAKLSIFSIISGLAISALLDTRWYPMLWSFNPRKFAISIVNLGFVACFSWSIAVGARTGAYLHYNHIVALGVVGSVACGVTLGVYRGTVRGDAVNGNSGAIWAVLWSLLIGFTAASHWDSNAGTRDGLVVAIVTFSVFFRVPIFLVEALFQAALYLAERYLHLKTFRFSPILYHEISYLPYPFLEKHLLLAALCDPFLVRRALDACMISPGQRAIAQRVIVKLQIRQLVRAAT
jgi:Calcineurin-like phosphoesterase